MKKEELIEVLSGVQLEADKMAYMIIRLEKLARIQSICSFNVFWIDTLSPLVLSPKVMDFLIENQEKFKRKLSVREFFALDLIVKYYDVTIDELRERMKNYLR